MRKDEPASPEIIQRPSTLPTDRRFEEASRSLGLSFKRTERLDDDALAKAEETDLFSKYDTTRLQAKIRVLELIPDILNGYKRELENEENTRQTYAGYIFLFVVIWLVAILFLIASAGQGQNSLSDSVLVALTVGATVSVVGRWFRTSLLRVKNISP